MNLLLVEDNPPDARIIREMLKTVSPGSAKVKLAARLDEALDMIGEEAPDVVLLDMGLPDSQGMATLTTVVTAHPDLPIVVLTHLNDDDFAAKAVRFGAQDYLVKGSITGEVLLRTLHYAIERHRSRRQLALSEAAQRALAETKVGILNALPAHIAILDADGVITDVNESWRRFAAANHLQSEDFYIGQNYLDVCESAKGPYAEEALEAAAGIRQILSGQESLFTLEYPCHSPTEKRWFRLMVTPLADRSESGAVIMHINVTERRLAEEAVREREIEQRQLAEKLSVETQRLHESQIVASIGSWETDLASLEVSWSKETFRIFEKDPAHFKPSHEGFLELIHPEDRAKVNQAFVDSHRQPERFSIEHRICLPGGRIKHVEERWQTFPDSNGESKRAVGTCQDITARKLADEVIHTRARQQEAIARIGFEATKATSLEDVFDCATEALMDALQMELCKILQLLPDGSYLRLVSGKGWKPGLIGVATVGVEENFQAGFTLKSKEPVIVHDFGEETRFSAPPLLVDHGVVSGLSASIPLRNKRWGILGVHSRYARKFDEDDANFIQSVTTILSVVIERLAMEQTLSESERRLRDAQRIAHLGNWELELASNTLLWCEEIFRILDISPADFNGTYEAFLDLVHPEDRERVDDAQQRAITDESILEISYRIIRPNGGVRHVQVRAELIHDESGNPVTLAGTVLDITDAVRVEVERDRIFNLSIDLLSVGTFEGQLEQVNPAWTRCLGWTAEELTSRPWLDFVHPDDYDATVEAGARLARGEPLQGFENRYRGKDGSYRWLSWNSTPLPETRQIFGVCRDVTEQRQRQEQLRLLETCVSRLNDIVLITEAEPIDEPGPRIVYVNDAFVRLTGFSREEALGKSPRLLQGPKTQKEALKRIREALEARKPIREELINYTKSGEEYWLELEIVPVTDAKGRCTHFVAVERDITERRETEEALRQSEAHLQFILKSSRLGDWKLDLTTGKAQASLLHDRCFGYTELIGDWDFEKFISHVHPEDRLRVEQNFHDSIERHAPWDFECRVVWPDGGVHWISVQGAVFEEDGKRTHMHGIVRDITARKQAETALADSEERFRLMIEGSEQILFYTHDREHVFEYLSPSTRAVLGYDPEELMGEKFDILLVADDPLNNNVFELTDKALQEGRACDPYLAAIRHKEGRRVIMEIHESPILHSGKVTGIQGFARDITEQKLAREKIQRQLEELERWRNVTLGREDRIQALKQEVNELLRESGKPSRYAEHESQSAEA